MHQPDFSHPLAPTRANGSSEIPEVPPLLMGTSVAQLRNKLSAPASCLNARWHHFLTLARNDPQWYSPYTVLAAIVTGSEEDRAMTRAAFLRFVDLKDEGYSSLDAQFHTHVVAAPLGRWAIYYDWVADLGLFSPAEDEAIRAAMLDYAHVFALQNLKSRMRTFENQILASAFCAAAVGYVFGIKRGDSALGRRLYSDGIAWLGELLDLLPPGGYNPEGSAYHEFVVLPLAVLSALLVQETTGKAVIECGPVSQPTGIRQLLETSHRMIGPAGLMPAWDAYGFHPAAVKCGLALLAKVSGDAAPLHTLDNLGMWYRSSLSAWEVDDRLWTLVWWPEDRQATATSPLESWMEPLVGGALQSGDRQLRLFQYWDECGGLPSSGRYQVDPNAITFEAFGSPLLLDGGGKPGPEIVPILGTAARKFAGARTLETVKEYCKIWGDLTDDEALQIAFDGNVGMSNALVVDDEYWYVPQSPRRGFGEMLHQVGGLQVLRSDATAFYSGRYDVRSVKRTSMLVGGEYVLVTDDVRFDTPHAITWQAYLRENAARVDGGAVLSTAEGVRCEVLLLSPGETSLQPVMNYPSQPDGHSALLRHKMAAAVNHRVDAALIPQSLLEPVLDLSEGWERSIDSVKSMVALDTAYLSDPFHPAAATRQFRRDLTLRPDSGQRYILALSVANPGTTLRVNGQMFPPLLERPSQSNWETGQMQPSHFDITSGLRPGENCLLLEAPFFHGESLRGPVTLHREVGALPVSVVREGPDCFVVTTGNRTDHVLVARDRGEASWAGGCTDARFALLADDGSLSAVGARRLQMPLGLDLRSERPCDVFWNQDEMVISTLAAGSWLDANWGDSFLRVHDGGCLTVQYRGANAYRLRIDLAGYRTVLLNGKVVRPRTEVPGGSHGRSGSSSFYIELPPALGPHEDRTPDTSEAVYALAESSGAAAAAVFVQCLESTDWRVSLAAAEVIGQLGIAAAIPALLCTFEAEEAALPYPVLTQWWRGSKMLRSPDMLEGHDENLEMPAAVKRWRVKRAVVTALGKLGDSRAVGPLEQAMDRGDDFFPVTSQLAVALGRLGAPSSLAVLQRHCNHAEVNTRAHTRLALALLQHEIDRAQFESRVGLN